MNPSRVPLLLTNVMGDRRAIAERTQIPSDFEFVAGKQHRGAREGTRTTYRRKQHGYRIPPRI
jgi:hypothetical protein